MTTWALLAPGPSASAADAVRVRAAGIPLGAVGNSYQLAPWAAFIAAADAAWWRRNQEAIGLSGEKYAMAPVAGVERVAVDGIGAICNSGVLALEIVRRKGATRILLLGFDMRGTHFFGPYTNGLRNTNDVQRRAHMQQFEAWARANRGLRVINCTEGSALTCFPKARLDEAGILEPAADEAGQGGDVQPRAAA